MHPQKANKKLSTQDTGGGTEGNTEIRDCMGGLDGATGNNVMQWI